MNWIIQKTDPRYVLSEGIQLTVLLTMWGLIGKKLLNEKVGESNIEEWFKCIFNEKKIIFCR